MAKYKIAGSGVQNTETTAFIPDDKNNIDWQEYQQWLKDGGVPDPQFTQEEIEAQRQFEKTQAENAVVNARAKLDAATAEGLEIEAECLAELQAARGKLTALKTIEIREPAL